MILSSAVLKNIIREALETAESDENSFDISIVIDMLEYIIDRYYEADCSFILANQDHRFVITAAQILDSVDFNELGIMIADNERIDPYANDSFIAVLLWEKFKVQNKINDITNIDFVSLRNVISEIFDEFLKQAEDDEDADMLNVTIEEDDSATHLLQKILQLCHANEKINELCNRTHSRELWGFIATSIDPGNNELMIPRISAMIIRFIKQNNSIQESINIENEDEGYDLIRQICEIFCMYDNVVDVENDRNFHFLVKALSKSAMSYNKDKIESILQNDICYANKQQEIYARSIIRNLCRINLYHIPIDELYDKVKHYMKELSEYYDTENVMHISNYNDLVCELTTKIVDLCIEITSNNFAQVNFVISSIPTRYSSVKFIRFTSYILDRIEARYFHIDDIKTAVFDFNKNIDLM